MQASAILLLSVLLLTSVWSIASIETLDGHSQAPHNRKRKRRARPSANENNAESHVQTEREPRIVGGTLVRTDKYPYFVRIDNGKGGTRGICGGNLVAPDIVLTAGHCLKTNLKVVVNGYNRSIKRLKRQRGRQVQSARRHPLYNGTTWENDYLLLKLKTKVDIKPIPLNFNASVPQTGDDLIAVGMGRQTEDGNLSFIIRDVTIPAADPTACFEAYQQIERRVVPRTMLCAGTIGKSPCKGDSGGPLLTAGVNKALVGIISWGAGCGRKSFPTVFARCSGAQEWLTANICGMSGFPPSWCPPTPAPTPAPPSPPPVTALEAPRKPTVQSTRFPAVTASPKTSPRPTVRAPTLVNTAAAKITEKPTDRSRAPTVRGVTTTSLTEPTLMPTVLPVIEPIMRVPTLMGTSSRAPTASRLTTTSPTDPTLMSPAVSSPVIDEPMFPAALTPVVVP